MRHSTSEMFRVLWRHPGHLIWVALAYLPLLGGMSVPLTGDQKVYISTSMEMVLSKAWLQPLLFGTGSYYKPPLQYWATILGWKLFGFNLWGTFLPSFFAAILAAYLLSEIALLLGARRWFVNVGLLFAATVGTVTYGTTAQMEIYVVLFYAGSWWAGLQFLSKPLEERDWQWIYLAFLIAGVAAIIKSPLYSVFWVSGYFSFLLLSGQWETFRNRHLYLAWTLGSLVGMMWYAYMFKIDGARFWSEYVIRENIDKTGGNEGTAPQLWMALSYFSAPFTLLAIPAGRTLWRSKLRSARLIQFLFAWSWGPTIFFSAYPYRIKPYLYIVVPAVMILVDHGFFWGGKNKFFRAMMAATGTLILSLCWSAAFLGWRLDIFWSWILIGLVVAGFLAFFTSMMRGLRGFAISSLLVIFLYRALAVNLGELDIADLRAIVARYPTAPVAMWDQNRGIWHEVGLMSVGIAKPIQRLESLEAVITVLKGGGIVALTEVQVREQGPAILEALPQIERMPWHRWKVRAHFPYKQLLLKGRAGIPDFDEQTQRMFEVWKAKGLAG